MGLNPQLLDINPRPIISRDTAFQNASMFTIPLKSFGVSSMSLTLRKTMKYKKKKSALNGLDICQVCHICKSYPPWKKTIFLCRSIITTGGWSPHEAHEKLYVLSQRASKCRYAWRHVSDEGYFTSLRFSRLSITRLTAEWV